MELKVMKLTAEDGKDIYETSFPKEIRDIVGNQKYVRNDIGLSGSEVYEFSEYVLKVQRQSAETDNENNMVKWLDGKLPLPQIPVYAVSGRNAYTLMSRITGKMLCDEEYMENPTKLVNVVAEGLKLLWSINISKCPYKLSRLDERLRVARWNVEHGLVNMEQAEEDTFGPDGFKNPEDLLTWLEQNRTKEDLVLTHGDFCLPNVFARDNHISGFIDFGKMGPADRWQDIAIVLRSLEHNFAGVYNGGKAYPGYRPQMLLDALDIEMDEKKNRYYMLLDELF